MKTFLLAAGYGTRLRPLTDTLPKCLVPICGRPLLDWWMDLLGRHGAAEVLINTHYLPEQVRDYIRSYNTRATGTHLVEAYEPELLGSGGTVLHNRNFVANSDSFLVCYADNLTNIDLSAMEQFHAAHDGILTMALFNTNKPSQCGIADVATDRRIVSFEEKPAHPASNLANAGIYIARQDIFNYFPDKPVIDFGKDVLPQLVGRMYAYKMDEYLLDIGTPDNLAKAQKEWKML